MTKNDSVTTSKPISFSFAGCGFLGLYHVGVASCLREYAPINRNTKIGGASAGSLAAMALACDLPLGESTSEILSVAIKARSRALGPFHPSFDVNRIIYESLVKTLPDDAHLKANGRLNISVTRISDGKNVIINKFKSKEELIKAIQCSCFIPLWSGLVPPKFNGISYIDGGCSDNLPIIDENTVTISPFSGESDICPQDDTYNLFQLNLVNTSIALTPANFYRMTRILFPAHPEVLSKMCQQGFDDALRYLQRNNKISCTRCLAIHFTLEKEDANKENEEISLFEQKVLKHIHSDKNHSPDNCRDCEYRRQIADFDSLPESVVQAIQEACDQVNKGIINWLFRHKPMKLLSILSIPYLLPIDITIVLFSKVYERLPDIKRELRNSLIRLVSFLRSLLVKMETNRYFYSAKFSCQLDLKEFNYAKEESLKAGSGNTRKISSTSSTLSRKKSSVHAAVAASAIAASVTSPVRSKPSKVEKANSFSGRKNSEYRSVFSSEGIKSSLESVVIPSNVDQQLQQQQSLPFKPKSERLRKTSYAGREFGYGNYSSPNSSTHSSFNSGRGGSAGRHQYARRRSMIEIDSKGANPQTQQHPSRPERVISQLNFDFKLDMKNSKSTAQSDKSVSISDISRHHSIDSADGIRNLANSLEASLNSLSGSGVDAGSSKVLDIDLTDIDQSNVIDIANKALDWEKELIDKCRNEDTDGDFEQIFEITRNQDAALAYYYTDPVTDKVKFTELFNITNIDLKDVGDDTDADDYDILDDDDNEQCTAAGDTYTEDADDEYDDEYVDEHQKTLLPSDQQRYQQQQMETYNDSDDGLIETTPPATLHSNSVKSSLSSLHSAPSSPSLNESKSPSKRMRKKSVLVD